MTVPALWRLYFGWLSRHIRFSTFLGLYVTTMACKLYSSCPCCVIIKLRVPVYSVRVGISLDSLVKLAVCRFISCVCNTVASSRKIKHKKQVFLPFFFFQPFVWSRFMFFFLILLMAITVYSNSILLILKRTKIGIKS